ncbi:MAG: HAD family hydrolase [Clostridia bacterium]|nr:HAD family hydrolase [Clostridia bacterium]
MKYDSVIFDLDGTLLDTLEDLCDSTNFALSAHNMPRRTLSEVRSFLGNGIRNLIRTSCPEGTDEEEIDRVLVTFRDHYKNNIRNKTKPYDGVISLLEKLKSENVPTAVVSNKVDVAVKMLVSCFFGSLVDVAVGELEGVKRKPAPDTVRIAMEKLCVTNPVYVGDSEVDVQTAKNAGLDGVFVTWGFRSEDILRGAGAEVLVHDADELWEVIA